MRFEGRMSGESVGPTMPLLTWKGYRGRAGRWGWEPIPAILRRRPPIPGNVTVRSGLDRTL